MDRTWKRDDETPPETISRTGEDEAATLGEMSERVYVELKRIAAAQLRRERPGHTLQPTALVHEAYLNLAGSGLRFESRAHFLAIAARSMRQVLVHHARNRNAAKRGQGAQRVTLDDSLVVSNDGAAEVEALDDALRALEESDPRKSHILELRFFGGLTEAEVAEVLGISVATVSRETRLARALLLRSLHAGSDEASA